MEGRGGGIGLTLVIQGDGRRGTGGVVGFVVIGIDLQSADLNGRL